ncbi:hypothetical protein FSP39_023974 [Pinctada imbricata]|uniref:CCHC-type domain-containing protein n=1 Tax=Pinctada imbricata TaxID=66713 RepID=A0AA88XK81_PINIB|nr:hypothetical protein FSP39_023974 [Pinctada imbricata]
MKAAMSSKPDKEERGRKLSEKGMSYKSDRYSGIVSALKQTAMHIRKMMAENETLEKICKRYAGWLTDYEHFLALYDELLANVNESEKEALESEHSDYDIFLTNFKKEVENYFSFQQVKSEPTERGTKKSNRGSQRTKSRLSTVGDISSKLLKEEQTKAELEARKIALDRKRDIEIAKLQLRFQEEELELDTNIAVSSAKSKVLQQFERYENDFSESDEENPKEHIPMPTPRTTLFTEVASLSTIEELGLNPHAKSFVPDLRQKRDFTVKVEKTDSHIQKPEVPNEKTGSQVKRSDTVPKDTESAAIQSVVQYLRRPIPEIKKFGGNPLEFRRFLRQFHAKVVLNTHDDDERMNYLEQLTYGEANRCVAGFSHLSGDRAYKAAMKQLEERYGDNEVIATAFIKKALDWPAVKDAKSLDEFALFLVECLNAAESMGSNSVLDYPDNIKRLMQKLPIYMHDRWRNVVLKTKEVNIANEGSESAKQETVEQKCIYCDGSGHFISDCKGFLRISLQDRYNFLRNKGLCYGCPKKGHLTKKCRGRHKCSICGRRHPTALHDPTRVPVTASAETGDSHPTDTKSDASLSHNPDVTATTDMRAGETTCAMAIIPVRVKLKDRNHSVATYAFFDSGSSVSFCTDSLMRQLGASGKKRDITLSTMGEDYKLSSHILKGLQVTDLDMNELVDLPQVYTKDRMPVDKGHIPTRGEIHDWPHLSHKDIPDIDVEVGLLLGSNVPDAYAPQEVITGPSGSPHATRTRLGWIIWNVLRSSREDMQSYTVNRAAVENHIEMDMRLEQLVKDSINLEFPERASDDVRQNSEEDNMFLKQVEESICHQDNRHYSIKLPFRDQSVRLPNNVQQGVQRLGSLKRKFQKSERFKTDYVNFMNKLFDKGYAEIIPKDHIDRNDGRVWFLPHHGIYPVKKPDKIRVVFDCSATYEGISLNSQLLQGPDLTNSLLGVLLRFRQESIAIQGDIEAMFHQVEVPESDRECLRFLWWRDGNLDKEPEHCRMKVHLFGATSSPSCCNFALQQTVKDHKDLFSQEVTNAVARNMYVDDCLLSVNSEHKAESIIEDLSMLCKKGGFHLEKFVSNSKEVLNSIPEAERAGDVKQWNLNGGTLTERALGVYWFVDEDVIGFKISLKQQPVTRRGILSTVSSIYDPLGIVSPFVMTAKILLQQLCKSGIKWDDKITGKLEKVWTAWLSQAKELESVKIPRCYKPRDMDRIVSCQLHVFADASEVGMGVVIYMRLTDDNSRIRCSFVLGKARVTPLKAVTIPRLELTACTMAVKLSKVIADQLEYSIDAIHFWTDSMSVLRYIANTKTRFKTFVANRLAVIHDATTVNQWHYVRSEDNPADCASGGIPTVSKFLDYTPWLGGPEFLWKPESTWIQPVDPGNLNLENDKEVKSNLAMTLTLSSPKGLERLIEYHSDWKRLKHQLNGF